MESSPRRQPVHVELNVGGTHYTTSITTLTRYPDSKLHNIFSKNSIALAKDVKGRYIIDRDGKVFRYILNFLRGGNLNLHPNFKDFDQLKEEVKYFKLKEMENLLKDWQAAKTHGTTSEQNNSRNCTEERFEDNTSEIIDVDAESLNLDNQSDNELNDEYDSGLWMMDSRPRRSPYLPQIGDEVIYFWQGHKCYVDAVQRQRVYDIEGTKFPWDSGDLKTEELTRVVNIEYHSGTPITCDIKLASIDHVTKKLSGKRFQVRYHVMPEVVDFLILRQHYELSMKRNWRKGDEFRTAINGKWRLGVIKQKTPIDEDYPDSLFQCFAIRWDNGEPGVVSPWNLEPVPDDSKNTHNEFGRGRPITTRDMEEMQYNAKPDEWGESDQNTECRRILICLDQIMSLKVAKILDFPNDGSDALDESVVVPYPITLEIIKKRLDARYYRRRLALQWEVRQIEDNAKLFNEPNSEVVTSAELVTHMLLEVIRNAKLDNAIYLYNRVAGITDSDHKIEKRKRSNRKRRLSSSDDELDDASETPVSSRSKRTHDETRWKTECKNLLEILLTMEESKHFRIPINQSAFKIMTCLTRHSDERNKPKSVERVVLDYADVIEYPMDLTTVKERMNGGNYEDPHEFAKDVRLIVSNSKAYFTDKKLEIHAMTRKFSNFFEDCIRETLENYKNAAAYKKLTPKGNGFETPSRNKGAKDQKKSHQIDQTLSDKPGPSGIKKRPKVTQDPVPATSQGKDDDDDIISLIHASSGDENHQNIPSNKSSPEHEDYCDGKGRGKTPAKKSTGKSDGCRKSRDRVKSNEKEKPKRQRKISSSSSSSSDSIFNHDVLHDSFESADTKKRSGENITYDKNGEEDLEDREKKKNFLGDNTEAEESAEYLTISSGGRVFKLYG